MLGRKRLLKLIIPSSQSKKKGVLIGPKFVVQHTEKDNLFNLYALDGDTCCWTGPVYIYCQLRLLVASTLFT
jgi:hypothetical protein